MHRFITLHLFVVFLLSACAPPSKDTDVFVPLRINCGGEVKKDSKTGVVWMSDKEFLKKGKKHQFEVKPFTQGVEEPAPKDVYQSARRAAIAYRFKNIPDGLYLLRLHFMDGKKHARRKMDFWVDDRRIMQNFNIRESADGELRAVVYECVIEVNGGHGMNLRGSKGRGDDVLLSGIEILAAPKGSTPALLADPQDKKPADLAAALRDFAGGPIRLAWTRTEDEDDFYQKDNTGMLCGFDSEDARGERIILSELRSYAMPIITPDGQKIVFTDQKLGMCFEVGFDGKGLRELVRGFASDVWRDPQSGRTWLYVRSGWSEAGATVGRYDLADLKVREDVWKQSITGTEEASWFNISGDGQFAADGFPWPKCGLVDMQADDLKIMGNGCWPSVSPDASHMYFYFLGKHTAIDFFDAPDAKSRVINLSTIPAWTGRKVYHPKWTNHVRYMTATAPQWMPETELYLGKFDATYENIERWFRVTYNQSADYFGDAWFANGSQPKESTTRTASRHPENAAINTSPGLVFVWENERAKNATIDARSKSQRIWNVRFDGETRPSRWYGADINNGGIIPSNEASTVVGKAIAHSKSISLAVDLPFTFLGSNGQTGEIAYLGDQKGNASLFLRQEDRHLLAGIKSINGELFEVPAGNIDTEQPTQLIATYSQGTFKTFHNGLEVSSVKVEADPAAWNPDTLLFGRDPLEQRPWRGSLENIRVFDRALSADEISAFHKSSSSVWSSRKPIPQMVVDAELIESSHAADPENIAPYTRSLAENRYRVKTVVSGQLDHETIIVLQWVILGRKQLPSADLEEGKTYRLTLEPSESHKELSGEHRSTDLLDTSSAVFYDVGS